MCTFQTVPPWLSVYGCLVSGGDFSPPVVFLWSPNAYFNIIRSIQSPHMMLTCFVALTLLPQQGQRYVLWWLLLVVVMGRSSPPLLACVPMPTAAKVGFALHISTSLNSLWSSIHLSRRSAGAVCAYPYRSERVTISPLCSACCAKCLL